MISAKKVMNIKVVELIKIYNFYFGHFFISQSVSKHCSLTHIHKGSLTHTYIKVVSHIYINI
jgi:hypothetical protein